LSTGVNVFNNKVYNIKNTYSIGYGSNGIMLSSSSTSSNIKVYNNLIYDVASYGYASGYGVTDNGYGIILTTGGGYNIYYNSVSLSTDQTVAGNPACFNVVSGVTALDVRNNIFSNTQTVGTNRFAIISQALTTTYSNLDYNDYYTTGAIIGYYNSANVSNIAAWKSTLGKDLNSVSGNPGFSSATNLQIDVNNANCWNVNAGAMPLASVTTDFNGTARNTTVSSGACDIGAYEFTPVATPANLTILNSFTDGGTSTITFAGVNIATITWHLNGGTLPTSLTADFQPGVNPSNTIGGSSYANENLVVTVPDGSRYLYDIVLGYNLARQGTIGSESVFRLAKYSNSTWTQYPATPNTGNRTISVTGLNSFSTFTFGDGNAPLPVQLSSFSSSINGRDVKLNWKTDKETNNSGFDVERAEVGSQNLEYKKIGYVKGNGNTNSPVSYTFDDKKLNSGKYNYRLKQLDYNGNYTYHNLSTTIDVSLPTKFNLSQNYPNPFNPTTKIDFELPFDSKVNIALYDMTGREVKTLVNESRTAGYYTVQFNALDLSSGTYFYRIITKSADKDFVATKKMVLIK
ncbi:MAG: T9SS type A sorting domain-containing protein, partial [Ignavibacteriota bacterium]